ncbi:hypothetical protein GWI33_009159, partial [Rhynchophorus ferrugineus]
IYLSYYQIARHKKDVKRLSEFLIGTAVTLEPRSDEEKILGGDKAVLANLAVHLPTLLMSPIVSEITS